MYCAFLPTDTVEEMTILVEDGEVELPEDIINEDMYNSNSVIIFFFIIDK